jgi:hypothetical protein
MTIREISIEDFTSKDDSREWVRTPFNRDGKSCACDGFAAVFFPLDEKYQEPESDKKFDVAKLVNEIESSEFIPMPIIEMPEISNCEKCNSTGKATTKECVECNGEGEVSFENDYHDYECECKSCDGSGEKTVVGVGFCNNCKGTGKIYERNDVVKIGSIFISANYLRLIIDVPDLQICTKKDKLLFKSGNISGLIMKTHP